MMTTQQLVKAWFACWENGDFLNLPITDDFKHTSPYGLIDGKKAYLELVTANKDKFLGHRFVIHDLLCDQAKACIRYSAIQADFELEVTEWHYCNNGLIAEIVAYYNIPGDVREDRKLEGLEP